MYLQARCHKLHVCKLIIFSGLRELAKLRRSAMLIPLKSRHTVYTSGRRGESLHLTVYEPPSPKLSECRDFPS